MMPVAAIPWWAWVCPTLAIAIVLVMWLGGAGSVLAAIAGVVLIATVFAAVFHAEVIAHRVGEPFGTLVGAVPGLVGIGGGVISGLI